MESILTSTKQLLGITAEYTHFDTNIIVCINSVFATLTQLGVGPAEGFSIKDEYASWSDYMDQNTYIEMVKTYMVSKVKLMFDPPTNTSLLEALKQQASELEWRLMVAAEQEAASKEA